MADYQMTIDGIFGAEQDERNRFLKASPADRASIIASTVPAKLVANSSHEHAGQVIGKLVHVTEEELIILGRKLATLGHSALRMQAHLCRHPRVAIRILVESSPAGPIYRTGKIDWANLTESALTELSLNSACAEDSVLSPDGQTRAGHIAVRVMPVKSNIHFVVSDAFSYRLEKDHESGKAIVNPKDPAQASKLVERFNVLWDLSRPAVIPVFNSSVA